MATGVLNPLDNAKSVATRPPTVLTGDNERRWFSDELDTIVKAQDLNEILGQIRHAMDYYSIADVEGSDTGLRQAIQAGAASLSGNLLRFQSLVGAADKVPYFTSAAGMALFTATSYSRGLLALTNQFQWANALGISASSSANVVAFGNLISAVDTLGYFTGSGTMAVTGFTAFARSLLDDVSASDARTTLGIGTAATHPDTDFAPLASPAFTGVPSAPTAGPGTNTTQLATTAFVQSALPVLAAIATSGSASDLVSGTVPSARLPASLSSVYALTPLADRLAYYTGASAAALTTFTAFARTILDDADAATVRTTLGLATVASSGSAADLTGTLASARLPASLSSIYALTPAADRLPYYTSPTVAALATFTAFARTILDDADAATVRATLGLAAIADTGSASDLVAGTVPLTRLPASLSSIYGLTPAADLLPYYTGAATAATTAFTAFARTLIDDADAATARTTLGLVAVASSGSAADLSTGTLASARLPASLSSIYALTPAADGLPYYTSGSGAALATFTAFARNLLDDASAVAARTTLGAANIAGDTFTGAVVVQGNITANAGNLVVNRIGDALAAIVFLEGDAGVARQISAYTGSALRWNLALASATAESGGNVGSNFVVSRYDDAGVLIDNPFSIIRSTGIAAFTQSPTAPTPTAGDSTTKLATTSFVATSFQPLNADLTAIAGLVSAADRLPYFTGASAAALATFTAFARTLLDDADAATARATLGLGTMATEVATDYALLAGAVFTGSVTSAAFNGFILDRAVSNRDIRYRTSGVDRWALRTNSIAEGGSNAGSEFQLVAFDDAGVNLGNVFTVARSSQVLAFVNSPTAPTPSAGDSTTKIATTEFVATSFQPLDADLTAIAGLVSAADRLPYYTGAGAAALATFTAFARTLLDDADATTARATLGLGTMATATAANYALLAGATFTGSVVSSVLNGFVIDRAVSNRDIRYRTSGVDRWGLRTNSTAEGGSNAGSDFQLVAFDDTGTNLGTVFTVTRSSQVFAFVVSPTAPTPAADDNTTKLATTAYVQTEITAYNSISAQSGTTITVVAGMYGALVTMNNASAQTCALPADATLAVPIGTRIDFMQIGAGQCTFSAGAGATVNSRGGLLKTLQWGKVHATKRAANTWTLSGDGLSA
jgi:hypothetical protein